MLRIVELITAAACRAWTSRSRCSLWALSVRAVQASEAVTTKPIEATIMAIWLGLRERRAGAPSAAPPSGRVVMGEVAALKGSTSASSMTSRAAAPAPFDGQFLVPAL